MKYIYILFLIILIPATYVNVSVYRSHQIQLSLLQDFNSGNFREETTTKFLSTNFEIPNLTITAMPIKHLISRYYFLGTKYKTALQLIDEGNRANPYMKIGNSLKSEIYYSLGVYDSSYFYSKDAFTYQKNNVRHFINFMKNLSKKDQFDEIIKAYRQIERTKNPTMHQIFLSTLLTVDEKFIRNDSVLNMVNKIYLSFSKNSEINVLRDMILYGKENTLKSEKESKKATEFFQKGMIEEAIITFKNASKLNPSDYSNYENLGLIHFQKEDYISARNYLEQAKDTIISSNGKTEYLLGLTYGKLSKKDSACYYLKISKELDFKPAFNEYIKACY